MRKYVIMGVQGSGKGTQSQMLASDLDLVHISVGDIFRFTVDARPAPEVIQEQIRKCLDLSPHQGEGEHAAHRGSAGA